MKVVVKNRTTVARSVDIVNLRTRVKTQIMLQPKATVTLPRDFSVAQNYLARNPNTLIVVQKEN